MAFSFGNAGGAEKKTGTLFGSTTAPPGGLFAQPQQQQPAATGQSGLFGSAPQNNSLFGNTNQQQQQQQQGGGGLFGNTNQQQQGGSGLFGQSQQAQQPGAGSGLFSQPQQQQNAASSLWGQPQQQQQQAPQQPAFNNSLFGASLQPAPPLNQSQAQSIQQQRDRLPQLRQSSAQPYPTGSVSGQREKSVVEQIRVLNDKWDPNSPNCVFQYYFYRNVTEDEAAYYGPTQGEDHRKWEEALSNKPFPGCVPVLCRGFEEVGERIAIQTIAIRMLRERLHQINNCLTVLKDAHELDIASRISEAKRKHIVATQRTLALATKVQILRNRGYVMDQQEEELKKKLVELEKKTFDPVLGGRQEEIWARMSGVRERARILQEETEKVGKAVESQQNGELLTEDDQKALEKLLQDYDRQLEHLKKWVVDTKEEYDAWETEKQARPTKR